MINLKLKLILAILLLFLGCTEEEVEDKLTIVVSSDITEITSNSAVSGGEIIKDGGDALIERGVCWSLQPNPTIDNFRTIDGSGIGLFTSNITGLTESTKYYLRAYAKNSTGITYSTEKAFTTMPKVYFERHDVDTFNGASDGWVVDIDNDGFKDIVGTSYSDGICWWKNDGHQNFTRMAISSSSENPFARTVRATLHDGSIIDLNNDGYVDLVTATMNNNQISIWINNGSGSFIKTIIDNQSFGAHTVDVVDINKDGYLDILIASMGNETKDGEFAIYYNNGNLGFAKEKLHATVNSSGTFIHSGDIDDDGDIDILYTEWIWNAPSQLGLYRKTDLGWEKYQIDAVKGFHTAMLKDLDKDGDLDILAAAYNNSSFYIYTNDGNGNYSKTWEMFGKLAIWLDMADFDNDGDNDLLGAAQNPGPSPDLYWIENKGSNNFVETTLVSDLSEVHCAIPNDLDEDGDQDIIIMVNADNKVIWWENKLIE